MTDSFSCLVLANYTSLSKWFSHQIHFLPVRKTLKIEKVKGGKKQIGN
jgi:hypothetical protein